MNLPFYSQSVVNKYGGLEKNSPYFLLNYKITLNHVSGFSDAC